MTKDSKTIEERLKGVKFRELSESESRSAWDKISVNLDGRPAFLFPTLLANKKSMIPLLIGALIFASAGGTVAASNSAVPGDALFGIDRAVERVELALAGSGKAEIKLKHANERLEEVEKLIEKNRVSARASSTATSTNATTTATTTPKSNGRVVVGVNVALDFLNDVAQDLSASGNAEAAAEVNALVDRLESMINAQDVRVALKQNGDFMLKIKGQVSGNATTSATSSAKIKVNTSGNKDRIEIREDGDRIRIEIKGDEVKVKARIDDDNDEDENDDGDDDNDNRRERNRNEIRLDSGLKIDIR